MSETKSKPIFHKGTLYEIKVKDLHTDSNQPREYADLRSLQERQLMLIDCHECNALVSAEVLAVHEQDDILNKRTFLLKCPACDSALVGFTEQDIREDGELYWPEPMRVYPKPIHLLGFQVPDVVRKSIYEAERCMRSGAFSAATSMCGRALEAVCRHLGTKDTYLGAGIKELKDKGIIDARLYQWSEELRDARNRATHATDEVVTEQDAEDILSFTYAIIDYVFLLTFRFEQFQKRKKEREEQKTAPKAPEANT